MDGENLEPTFDGQFERLKRERDIGDIRSSSSLQLPKINLFS